MIFLSISRKEGGVSHFNGSISTSLTRAKTM